MEILQMLSSSLNLEMVLWSLLLACIMTLFSLVFAAYVEKDRPAAKAYLYWADRVAYLITFGFLPFWFCSGVAKYIPVAVLIGAAILPLAVALGEVSFRRFPRATVWSVFLAFLTCGICAVDTFVVLLVPNTSSGVELSLGVPNAIFGLSLLLYALSAVTLNLRFTDRYGDLRLVLPRLVKASS